jgi:hypothetical protein
VVVKKGGKLGLELGERKLGVSRDAIYWAWGWGRAVKLPHPNGTTNLEGEQNLSGIDSVVVWGNLPFSGPIGAMRWKKGVGSAGLE